MKVFKTNRSVIFFLILVSWSSHLLSQNTVELGCGTVTTTKSLQYYNDIKPELKKYQTEFLTLKSSQAKSSSPVKNSIPIKAHIIRTSNGTDGLKVSELKEAIEHVNTIFADAFMELSLSKDIDYIDDDRFYHFHSNEENDLVDTYNVSGVINIYFTDHIENSSDESICGYTHTEKRSNVIIMRNSCTTNDSSLAHELGHFFSLIHTHGIDNNKLTTELVNGSNCSSDGDQICDTPADPKLTLENVNNFCRYVGCETDANGDKFNPDTDNIMSYSMKGCRSHFSQQQLARIYAFYQSIKSDYSGESNETDIAAKNEPNGTNPLTDIRIYPNPITSDLLYIKLNNSESILNYEISNVMGQVFTFGTVTNEPINLSQLSSGTYLMTIKNKTSKIVKRIIK